MRLFHKIAALVVLAAALPLATVGFLLVRLNERALEAEVDARFDQTARHAAESVAADVDEKAYSLARTTQTIPWRDLDGEEAVGALQLLARPLEGRSAELLRIRDGATEALIASWRAPGASGHLSYAAPPAPDAVSTVKLSGVTRGSDGKPQVIASTNVDAAACHATEESWCVVAVEIPLSRLQARLDEVRGHAPLSLSLVESDAHLIASSPGNVAVGTPLRGPVVDEALHDRPGAARRFADGELVEIGAYAPVGGFGWNVIVEEDTATALAAPRTMRRLTLAGSGAATVAALALAFLFARRLSAAIGKLAAGARAIAGGDLAHRIGARGSDEVAELGGTFDAMGDQLAASRAEIEAWNRQLEERVAARTEELRQAQAQLVEAQKLAALGQLGAGVAHEINNPLGGVIGHVQLLLADHGPGHADHEALKHIEEAARRASQVVHNLLRFSVQRKAPVYTNVDLNRVVRDTLSLTESLIRDGGVTLDVTLGSDGPRAWGDAGQLGQVLLNLLSNARTATPAGGTITVRTRAGDEGGVLTVEDTGKGITAEHRARIFEPFFTTKDEWSNVGLGLSVSFRIVSEHRGKISVESEVGRGARFTVAVPRDSARARVVKGGFGIAAAALVAAGALGVSYWAFFLRADPTPPVRVADEPIPVPAALTIAEMNAPVEIAGPDGVYRDAKVGDRLSATMRIRTGDAGSATLRASDGSTVKLLGATSARVEALGRQLQRLSLGEGQVEADVRDDPTRLLELDLDDPNSASGQAPAARTHGASFVATSDGNGRASVATRRGEVILSAHGKEVTIHTGQVARVQPGQAPGDPAPIPASLFLKVAWPGASRVPKVIVAGETSPGARVKVEGRYVRVAPDGKYRTELTLPEGEHHLQVDSIDVAGRTKQERSPPILIDSSTDFVAHPVQWKK